MTDAQRDTLATNRKPLDRELDVYGVTHRGNVRHENQDHFLICSLRKQTDIHLTSLPDGGAGLADTERLADLAMVADGVGGGTKGEEASRRAVEAVSRYVVESTRSYYTADSTDDEAFAEALIDGAMRTHMDLAHAVDEDENLRGMATTLTLWIGVWPRAYLLQVGDSRCYILRDGTLSQISRDQTMAQDLVDQGVLTRTGAFRTRWAHVLSSALGAQKAVPEVTQLRQTWGQVGLLCSDGLTKHVSDERIRERLTSMTSAKQVCEDLLQDALDDGGTDNITIIVGRTVRRGTE